MEGSKRVAKKLEICENGFFPGRWDWPSTIGHFLLNFGTLEYFVFVFLEKQIPADEFEKKRKLHLKDRVDQMAEIIAKNGSKSDGQIPFSEIQRHLEPLRELRNLIAHGHMYFGPGNENGSPSVTLSKARDFDAAHDSGSKRVKLSELVAACFELSKLLREFERLAGFKDFAPPIPVN